MEQRLMLLSDASRRQDPWHPSAGMSFLLEPPPLPLYTLP
jgi:hypothetical protein